MPVNQRSATSATQTKEEIFLSDRGSQRSGAKSRVLSADRSFEPSESLVVIGAGMSSYKLCERLRSLAGAGRYQVTLIGEESVPAYDRVNLNRMFDDANDTALQLAPRNWYEENGIELITGDPVVLIQRFNQTVITQSNQEIHYDKLVFATGSRAFVPAIPIACPERVHVYRTLDDLQAILRLAGESTSVAVIGGGLLGVEAAKGLHDLGLTTHIIDYSTGLLARHLNPQAASIFNDNFARFGINVRTQLVTEHIEERNGRPLLKFTDRSSLTVDFVVIATGVRPRDELAKHCGLDLGARGGIKVDHYLRTSDPRIFAIGECASHEGTTYGLAAPGFIMADVLAERLSGKRRKFNGAEQTTSLKLPECPMNAVGDYQFDGSVHTYADKTRFRQLVCDGRRLVGAVVVGDCPELPRLQEAINSRRRLWRSQTERFRHSGLLWPDDPSDQVALWPPGAVVCNCMRVERKTLTQALARGCSSVESLATATGASTVCGSCKPQLAQLVGAEHASVSAAGWKWLFAASFLAVVVSLFIVLIPEVPTTKTVQGGWKFETLWRDPFLKKVSGFTMLGLIVASLALSLRKRVRWINFGQFGWWRFVHGALGVLTIFVLVTHTGLSLGHNLNFVLMLNFLALAGWGGLAGLVTSLEHTYSGYAGRKIRQIWTWIHIGLVWPLPALIAFHIISVYWF